ncbi:MAG: gliding motility-associated C-terminal domain-containing protein [Flavobacteriales bacterium]|nr:gliding motility-associated C-terminal domain-containing protein [Flavobacteriales bacterium]
MLLAFAQTGVGTLHAQCAYDVCGYWYCEEYNSGVPVEYLAIDYINGELVCTKVLGDAYVTTGQVSWRGVPSSCSFPGRIYGTNAPGGALASMGCQITILSADHIQLSFGSGMDFYRSTTEHLQFVGVDYSEFPVSCVECPLPIPNVFTPNGDGVNDLLEPICGGRSERFAITDRWGRTVYEVQGIQPSWDGRNGWDPCPPGVYYWSMIDSRDRTGKIRHGVVHLFR